MKNKTVTAPYETVGVKSFARELELEIVYEGRGEMTLSSISVSRPGLLLSGYYEHFDNTRIEVMGHA